jgi:crossover junction endodeoxyribonuclease RuvC
MNKHACKHACKHATADDDLVQLEAAVADAWPPFVIGVDPGLAALGLARVQIRRDDEHVAGLAVARTQKDSRKHEVLSCDDTMRRAAELADALERWLLATPGEVVAIVTEAVSMPRSGSVCFKQGLAFGVLAAVALARRVPVIQVTPQNLKRAVTGDRSASKEAVQVALTARYGAIDWPRPAGIMEHAADALGAVVAALPHPAIMAVRRTLKRGAA